MVGVTENLTFSSPVEQTAASFQKRFGHAPKQVSHAPGRVNLIGEHTDYNDGFVMPVALELSAHAASSPRDDRTLHVYSDNFSETVVLNLDHLCRSKHPHWSSYIAGVAAVLATSVGPLRGANLAIRGDVPIGGGLSSSAAIEVATAVALLANAGIKTDFVEIAKCCQTAEREYTGTQCGIMDQFVSCFGRAGHALLLDCRTLDYQLLPLGPEISIVICNSNVRHELASGEYNQRRMDCDDSVHKLRRFKPDIKALRDVTQTDLEEYGGVLSERALRRCRHVIAENNRVVRAAQMLAKSDLRGFGALMYESHASLRDLYEVSCRELDLLVETAETLDGVYGARMTGGGFGGCTVNLIHAQASEDFCSLMAEKYRKQTGLKADIYGCRAADGASRDSAAQPAAKG